MIYAPPPKPRKAASSCTVREGDSPTVAAWRERMAANDAKKPYKLQAGASETINAGLRCYRGLGSFAARGLRKVTCVALWPLSAYNVMHFAAALLEASA